MRKGRLNREQAVSLIGIAAVNVVESKNCEPTSRLQTDGDDDTEWSASVTIICADGLPGSLTAYYYLTPEQMQQMSDADGDGSAVDWKIHGYDIE